MKNRILNRMMKEHKLNKTAEYNDYTEEEIREKFKTGKQLAEKYYKLLEEFKQAAKEMEDYYIPNVYMQDEDKFMEECKNLESGLPIECSVYGDSDIFYNRLNDICKEMQIVLKKLKNNLI